MKLSESKEGKTYTIIGFEVGRKADQRLQDMGLVYGTTFKVRRNETYNPILLEVVGTQLVVGRGIAEKVIIEEKRIDLEIS